MIRKVKATEKQKRAVNNIISGNFKSRAEAMEEAGYSKTTSGRPGEKLFKSKGVEAYIKSLDVTAQQKWGLNLPDKVALTFLDGLESTRITGNGIEVPDWLARLNYADRLSFFLGWNKNTK